MNHSHDPQLATFRQWPLTGQKASQVFGQVFLQGVEARFLASDSVRYFTERWAEVKDMPLEYANGDSWDKMLDQGQALLEQFRQDKRVLIEGGQKGLQVKFRRLLPLSQQYFSAWLNARGYVDGRACVIKWQTSTQAYPANLRRVLEFDPELICSSWAAQWQEVALISFVRANPLEIQYLRARIRQRQWTAFEHTVDLLARKMEGGNCYPQLGRCYPEPKSKLLGVVHGEHNLERREVS